MGKSSVLFFLTHSVYTMTVTEFRCSLASICPTNREGSTLRVPFTHFPSSFPLPVPGTPVIPSLSFPPRNGPWNQTRVLGSAEICGEDSAYSARWFKLQTHGSRIVPGFSSALESQFLLHVVIFVLQFQ